MHQSADALIVLGMHRSGTSTVTGTLGLCGAWVGERDELTGAGRENPKGFFERRDLRKICDSLLFAADADWWKISAFRPEAVPQAVLDERRAAFAELIRSLAEHGSWVIKEPRLCLLFPLLRPVIPEPVCVHSFRNPLEVAKSLRARNGFSIMQGLALWEAYTRAALAASEGLPRVFVSYEALVAAPVEETTRLVRELAAHGVSGLRLPAAEVIEDFITPELRRQRSAAAESMELLEPPQQELWERIAAGEDLPTDGLRGLSPRSLQHLRDLEAQHATVLSLEKERSTMLAERKEMKATLSEQGKVLGEHEKLKAALADDRKLMADRTELQAALADQRKLDTAALAQAREREAELAAKLSAAEEREGTLVERLRKASKRARKESQRAERLEFELSRVYRSSSWKMTAPIRTVQSLTRPIRRWRRERVEAFRKAIGASGRRPADAAPTRAIPGRRRRAPREGAVPDIVVYTCLFGAYEPLKEPEDPDPRVRWIVFTDDPTLKSRAFEIVHLPEARSSVRRTSRLPKILPHLYLPPHEVSIYLDASLRVIDPDVVAFAEAVLGQSEMALFRHHARESVFDEIEVCRELGIESGPICDRFSALYGACGGPDDFPLFENTLIVRRNTAAVRACNERWWELYRDGTQRDQLSLALALSETGVCPAPIAAGKQVRSNSFVAWTKHGRDALPAARPRIFIFIAYAPAAYAQNLGRAYNDYMRRLGDNDWAVFVDHDAMLRGRHCMALLGELAAGYAGRRVMFVGCTNRINNPYQRVAPFENVHDLAVHGAVADTLHALHRDRLHDVTELPSASGVVMMLSRRTWEDQPFEDGFLGVDNAMHKSFRKGRGRVYLARSLYAYHFYRADGDASHALRVPLEPSRSAAVSGMPVRNALGEVAADETPHFVRVFLFADGDGLVLADYLPLLRPGEWALFLSARAMFAQKSWNNRVRAILGKADANTLVLLNQATLGAGVPDEHDHLRLREAAAALEDLHGETLDPFTGAPQASAGFCTSHELLMRVVATDGSAPVSDLPELALKAGAEVALARGVVIQADRSEARGTGEVQPAETVDTGPPHLPSSPASRCTTSPAHALAATLQAGRRVAMITLGFWPQQAGMEMVFHNLAMGMTRAGDLVVLFTPMPDQPFEEIARNYIIRRYKNEKHFHRMFSEHNAAMPFDCILVQGAFEAATLARAAGEAHGVPVVLRTHGEDIQKDPTIGYGYRLDPKKARLIEDNIRQVAHNIAISTPVGAEVTAIEPQGPVTVIGNGVDTTHFKPQPSRTIREAHPQIGDETCILLMVGRNVKKKSLGLAVEALALLREAGHDVCLVHAGKPGSGENLRDKALALGVGDRFFELGETSYFDMPAVYASADIFVFPSKMETFGNVTLEAMASGLPCVEFDYGANHDKISEGETGFIVPWGDVPAFAAAIGRLVTDRAELRRMGDAARRAAEERFAWPMVVERYRAVIAQTARPRLEAP